MKLSRNLTSISASAILPEIGRDVVFPPYTAPRRLLDIKENGQATGGLDPRAILIVAVFLVVAIFLVISYFCIKKIKILIGLCNRLKSSNMTLINAMPSLNVAQVWNIDRATMEKFLQEMAREQPIRYSAKQIQNFTDNYSTRLGSGSFGKVYKGELPNGMKIAVKVLNKSSDRRVEEQLMAEVSTLGRTYHMNLVRLLGFCIDQQTSALVFEYMENGSLDKYLFSKKEVITWEKLCDIAIGTARGLAYLHEECQQKIIHYDIKPGNVLLDADFSPKVADFGLAKLCSRDNTHVGVTGYRGSPGYCAPEFILKNFPVTHKCDVYSFGMLLFEILGRKRKAKIRMSGNLDWFPRRIWEEYEKGGLVEMTIECEIEEKDREKAMRMFMVALWCVQDSPEARPLMSSVVRMLESGVEISPPPEPFQYLYSAVAYVETWKSGELMGSTGVDASTVMKKCQM